MDELIARLEATIDEIVAVNDHDAKLLSAASEALGALRIIQEQKQ